MSRDVNQEEITLDELVLLTEKFIGLADQLHKVGKISDAEYNELTFVKKNFIEQATKEKQAVIRSLF